MNVKFFFFTFVKTKKSAQNQYFKVSHQKNKKNQQKINNLIFSIMKFKFKIFVYDN